MLDNLGAGRAPLCYDCYPVIISHLFPEVGPRYLSNLRRRRRHQHSQADLMVGCLMACALIQRPIEWPDMMVLYKPSMRWDALHPTLAARRCGDRSYQLPKNVGLAGGPNTRKGVALYHERVFCHPQ